MIKTVAQLLERFLKAENEALKKQNIEHRPTIGDMYEGLTKSLLSKALPSSSNLDVSAGFIEDVDGTLSSELDCMLVCGQGTQIPFTDKFKYRIDDVIAVIQVKKNLYSADIESGYQNLRSFAGFTVSDSKRAVLLRDAFQSITRRPFPKQELIEDLPVEIQMIYNALVTEFLTPVRILLGYNGFKSHSAFRQAFVDYLSMQYDGTPKQGFGPTSFPHQIICGDYSLIKCNGMPFIAPLEDDNVWPFYCSAASKPVELLLELIWTRLVYQEQLDPSVFDEDIWLGSFARFISAKPVTKSGQQGWQYDWVKASEKQLEEPTEFKLWEPVFLDVAQFTVMNRLCHEGKVDLTDGDLLDFLGKHKWSVDSFVESLNKAGLAAHDGNELVLLTRRCSCVILPDGRYAAGENVADQLSRWMLIYIADRKNKKTIDALQFDATSFTIPKNEPLLIGDDEKAKKAMEVLGLLEPVEKARKEEKEKNLVIVVGESHPTHWIAAGHVRGFEKPCDNGYFLSCHPKAAFTLEQFKLMVQASWGCL